MRTIASQKRMDWADVQRHLLRFRKVLEQGDADHWDDKPSLYDLSQIIWKSSEQSGHSPMYLLNESKTGLGS